MPLAFINNNIPIITCEEVRPGRPGNRILPEASEGNVLASGHFIREKRSRWHSRGYQYLIPKNGLLLIAQRERPLKQFWLVRQSSSYQEKSLAPKKKIIDSLFLPHPSQPERVGERGGVKKDRIERIVHSPSIVGAHSAKG